MTIIKKAWPFLIMLIFVFIYFQPEFEGKKILGADSSQYKALGAARKHYTDQTGDSYIWNPGIFSGTSSVYGAVSPLNVYHRLSVARKIFISRGAWTFFLCLFFSYLLGIRMKFSKLLSLGLAFAITLGMSNIILYKVGHFAKIETLVITPFILMGIYVLFEQRKLLLGGGLLAFALGFSLYTRHPQMSYYLFLMMLPYVILKLIQFIKNKEYGNLTKIVAFGIMAVVIAVGGNIDRLWNMKVHGEASMRGGKILKEVAVDNTTTNEDETSKNGLGWEYAMAWSNTTPDVIATIIPGYAGGGAREIIDKESILAKKYGMKEAPLYWGGLPFTESPMYLGAILFFLMFLALYTSRSVWLWGLFAGVILSILISYGKNIEWFQRLIFDYLPYYNKFRAPQSILNITLYFIPVIGFVFLHKLFTIEDKKSLLKPLYIVTGSTLGLVLFFMLLAPNYFEMTTQADQRYVQQGLQLGDLIQARKDLLFSDTLRTLIYIALAAGIIWLFVVEKIKYSTMIIVVIVLISFDWITANSRYYSLDEYQTISNINRNYNPRPADQQILSIEKQRENYRVLDLSINTFNSGSGSYFHNTIGGYSPVKFQRYQDMIDRHISKINMGVLAMLNTKYVITQDGKVQQIDHNGVAWFVDTINTVSSPEEEISALNNMNTKTTAVVLDADFDNYISGFDPEVDPNSSIAIENYTPDKITYITKSSTDQFAVFSETWMDGESWIAYLDGEEVPFVRANYILRGLKIPAGEHNIVFDYHPKSQYLGGKIALVFGLIGLLFLIFGIRKEFKEKVVANID